LGIKERRQRQRQELRAGILAAAREIASSEGWQAVTIRKIAALIEYSPPVIYEYFASKEEILLESMRTGYAEQLRAVEAAGEAAGAGGVGTGAGVAAVAGVAQVNVSNSYPSGRQWARRPRSIARSTFGPESSLA